jgi:hypothetical protein
MTHDAPAAGWNTVSHRFLGPLTPRTGLFPADNQPTAVVSRPPVPTLPPPPMGGPQAPTRDPVASSGLPATPARAPRPGDLLHLDAEGDPELASRGCLLRVIHVGQGASIRDAPGWWVDGYALDPSGEPMQRHQILIRGDLDPVVRDLLPHSSNPPLDHERG